MFGFLSRRRVKETKGTFPFPFPEDRFRELIQASESAELTPRLPTLNGGAVVEVAPRLKPMATLMKQRGASVVVEIATLEGVSLKARADQLPLRPESTDLVLCRLPFVRREAGALLKEVARILKGKATLFLTDLHPYSLFVQEEHLKNPVTEAGLSPGFERYFRLFQGAGLVLEGIREVFFEIAHRKALEEEKKGLFEQYRKTPFLILLIGRKGGP